VSITLEMKSIKFSRISVVSIGETSISSLQLDIDPITPFTQVIMMFLFARKSIRCLLRANWILSGRKNSLLEEIAPFWYIFYNATAFNLIVIKNLLLYQYIIPASFLKMPAWKLSEISDARDRTNFVVFARDGLKGYGYLYKISSCDAVWWISFSLFICYYVICSSRGDLGSRRHGMRGASWIPWKHDLPFLSIRFELRTFPSREPKRRRCSALVDLFISIRFDRSNLSILCKVTTASFSLKF